MEPLWIGLITAMAVFFIFCLCFGLSGSKWSYTKYIKERNERVQRRRWNKYVRFLDPESEKELYKKIKLSSDAEFEEFLRKISPLLKRKYNPYELNEHTKLKRSIYNVINKFTSQFDYKRVKRIEQVFPMLKRVFFGPRLTKKVYSKNTLKRKFKFQMKSETEKPNLETIIDIAFFFNTTVNKILGLCYMQEIRMSSYYIKNQTLYEGLKAKGEAESGEFDPTKIQLDSTFVIPDPKILKNKKSILRIKDKSEEISIEKVEKKPFFKENFSLFYQRKVLLKPDGRKRLVASPVSYLKKYQRKILHEILENVEIPPYCTGFVKNRSIITNAQYHINAQTVIKIDLKNFFNSMKFYHAFEVFRGFGYNRPVSGILACMCTDWYTRGGRYVPQGAPSSPMIGNLYAFHLDKRLMGLWNKKGFIFSRYADDLTFSSLNPKVRVRTMIQATYKIIIDEKLKPNPAKTKVLRKQHKKNVTGITVNEKINIDRKWMNIFRGEIYRFSKFGLLLDENLRQNKYNQLKGKLAFLKMVNPEKAVKYTQYLDKF